MIGKVLLGLEKHGRRLLHGGDAKACLKPLQSMHLYSKDCDIRLSAGGRDTLPLFCCGRASPRARSIHIAHVAVLSYMRAHIVEVQAQGF